MNEPGIGFLRAAQELRSLDDQSFLRAIAWSGSAWGRLIDAASGGDTDAAYRELRKGGFGAAAQKRGKKTRLSSRKCALWSLDLFDGCPRASELASIWRDFEPDAEAAKKKIGPKHKKKKRKSVTDSADPDLHGSDAFRKRLAGWLKASDAGALRPETLLILFDIWRESAGELPADIGWPLWRLALTGAIETTATLSETSGEVVADERTLVSRGEIPFEAGLLFSAIKGSGKLNRAGASFLRRALDSITDSDGTPKAELLERISHWLSPLIRATGWSKEADVPLWDGSSKKRFTRLLEWTAAICRTDGKLALSNGSARDVGKLLKTASPLAGWKKKSAPARYLSALGNGALRSHASGGPSRAQTDRHPATQSDWARLACMRNGWSLTPDTIVLAHHGQMPQLDLAILGRPLLSGQWDIEVAIDGRPLAFQAEWECVCWFSDDDADFLELHAAPEPGVSVDRQVMLSRTEHFAVLADAVSAAEGSRIEHKSRIPVVDGIEIKPDKLTREWILKTDGLRARVFPLALPDDRIESARGSLTVSDGRIELLQQGEGGLMAPLVIDWSPDRRHAAADWRALTVTETGKPLPRSHASGHRLRVGSHHLFVYRSLKSSGEHRAVLGHHTLNETVIGLIDEEGTVDPILMVEPQAEAPTA